MRLLFIWLTLVSVIVKCSHAAAPVFRDDAAERVTAGFKRTTRRGVTKVDITKIEVNWQPFAMVVDKNTLDKDTFLLQMKVNNGEWDDIDQIPTKRGGGKYRWMISDILPCKKHSFKFIVKSKEGEESEFEYPTPVEAATQEEIDTSENFRPAIPDNFHVDIHNNQVTATWDLVQCVVSYEVLYKRILSDDDKYTSKVTESNSVVLSDDIESCSDYEIIVSSLTGNSYGEGATSEFSTPPDLNSVEKLSPNVEPTVNSVKVTWQAWEKLSCVESYLVQLCKQEGECQEVITIHRYDVSSTIEFMSETNLDQCSLYSFHLKPLYLEQQLEELVVPFKTHSPQLKDLTEILHPVLKLLGHEGMLTMSWSAVQCSSSYEIFQKLSRPDEDWELIGTTMSNKFSFKGVPCKEYKYGVKVMIDGQMSDIIETENTEMIFLSLHEKYEVPNLLITPTINGVQLSWDHAHCINEYKMKICQTKSENESCVNKLIEVDDPSQHNILETIEDLKHCTDYTFQLFPVSNSNKLESKNQTFTTLAPPPIPPANTNVNIDGNYINIEFNPVQCASTYKIYQKIENSEQEMILQTSKLAVNLPRKDPCLQTRMYATSIVSGEESEPTAILDDIVPPLDTDDHQPEIVIEEVVNTTATIILRLPQPNLNCQVEKYHLKYKNSDLAEETELNVAFEDSEEGKIKIDNFPTLEKGLSIQGRLKYAGFDSWSPWKYTKDLVSADSLKNEKTNDFLVPTLIGLFVAVAVVLVAVAIIVRRKKTQTKYQPANSEEKESNILKNNPAV